MKYIGVCVMLLGALLLIYAGFNTANPSNVPLATGLVLVLAGYLSHIFFFKKAK